MSSHRQVGGRTGIVRHRPLASRSPTYGSTGDLKPHRFRYLLTPKPDPAFDAKCADICEVYQAAAGADDSHRTISIDEMTGIQALERAAPGVPMRWRPTCAAMGAATVRRR